MTDADTNLIFRVATPDDAEQLQPFVKAAYRGDSGREGWTTESDLVADDRIDVAGIVDKINKPDSAVLIATDNSGSLVACCEVAKQSASVAYLGMFAVDPKKQNNGLGKQVLEYAEEYCRRVFSARSVEMNVIWPREELIQWYMRRGYRKTGKTKPFPYGELVNGKALRDDLYFDVLAKDLTLLE